MTTAHPLLRLPQDTATLMLAHPQRCAVCLTDQDFHSWADFLGPVTWKAVETAFQSQTGLTGDILAELIKDPKHWRLGQLTDALADAPGSTEMGSAFAVMLFARNTVSPQPQFLIDDALLEMLEHTDISDDIPVSVLTLPYPRCFIEFGRNRKCSLRVPNPSSGLHILEGAYIETGASQERGPGLFVMVTGSPLGHNDAMDDATNSLFISTANPDQPLREALAQARKTSAERTVEVGLQPANPEYFESEFEALKLLAKVLLYLNLPDARRTLHKDLTQAQAQALAKKNPSKRERAMRELKRLADYVLVSAPPMVTEPGTAEAGAGVKPHWRRGHYRMQAHGPHHSLRKLIFLQPVLVGALEARQVSAPSYVVKP